ncbi:DUF6020 family protein [Collinsella sp. AM12-1]|uniref:DUF6020 family protein n=1 Tax=Collinsella sp. AM12-1 TaxID=2292023 RepID=UPI000E4EBDCB|nr:DUF6020 family protein [Collinsella sp. AM12-1]
MDALIRQLKLLDVARAVLLVAASIVTVTYCSGSFDLFPSVLACVAIIASLVYFNKMGCGDFAFPSLVGRVCCLVLSLVFSLVLVLGAHIVVTEPVIAGGICENYIESYSALDIVAFCVMSALVFWVLSALVQLSSRLCCCSYSEGTLRMDGGGSSIRVLSVTVRALVIFLLYLPFFLRYCPGLFFGDTFSSFAQIMGWNPLSNHHPVAFTMMMAACIKIAGLMGMGPSAGVALLTVFQMACVASMFGYLSIWVTSRLGVSSRWSWLLVAFFGLSRYCALYSVALWKDPLFSCCLVLVVTMLADAVMGKGSWSSVLRLLVFGALALGVMLLRNNGLYICAALFVALAIAAVLNRLGRIAPMEPALRLAVSLGLAFVTCLVITGPVYSAMGVVPSEAVESAGIPLAQMARVAALDGDMSESDRSYMNELLPLDRYKEVYRPSLIDPLKWNEDFNAEHLMDGFWTHWASMLSRNPSIFFEAWELQTFGFWAPNVKGADGLPENYLMGAPYNLVADAEASAGVAFRNLLAPLGDSVDVVIGLSAWSISGAAVFWLLMFSAVLLVSHGRARFALPLLPFLLLYGTLFIASPIWYWPRYIVAAQFGLPVVLVVVVRGLLSSESRPKTDVVG